MRLIDADALMETINRHCYPVRHDMTSIEPGMTRIGILQAIQEQPTIEPERKKGKWIPVMNGRGGHCCNRCNGYAPSYMNGDEHLSDFCPNCGADMRGDNDEPL